MTRLEYIRGAELGELAAVMEEAGNNPWCANLTECLEDLDWDIPEERCRSCVIGWLLGQWDGGGRDAGH